MNTPPAMLNAWQAAQDRCRAAYDEAPDAFAQVLWARCPACSHERHHLCRSKDCACRAIRHRRGWFTW